MASSFNLKDPATLIGFLIGLLGVLFLGPVGAVVAMVVVVLIYYFTNRKNIVPAVTGALIGLAIAIVLRFVFNVVILF